MPTLISSSYSAREPAAVPAAAEVVAAERRGLAAGHRGAGVPRHGLPRAPQLHPQGPRGQELPRRLRKRRQGEH